MCIRRSFSFYFLSPAEVAEELWFSGSRPTPLHLWQQISLQLAKRSFCRVLLHSNACTCVEGMRECSERSILAGLWTICHLQLLTCTFL